MTTTVQRQTADINQARAMLFLGNIQTSPHEVLFEYIDNGLDAGAKNIWVVMTESGIAIIDDGHGMVKLMDHGDSERLQVFKRRAEAGELRPGEKVGDYISPRSRCSIEYMMQNIAFSAKTPQDDEITRGEKGIGYLGFLQIAQDIIYYTLPSVKLTHSTPQFPYVLKPANKAQLSRLNMDYEVSNATQPLRNPYGGKLQSGTQVVISGIEPGAASKLLPAWVAKNIQAKFAPAVKSSVNVNGCKIVVIDRMTNEGRKKHGGIEYEIQPPSYSGIPLLSETRGLRGGRGVFGIELYYDSESKDNSIVLRRRGNDGVPITAVPGLNIAPFNSGHLSGYIEFPNVTDDITTWSTKKDLPNESALKAQWVEILHDVAQVAQGKIAEIAARQTNVAIMKIAGTFERLTLEAIADDELFSGSLEKNSHRKIPTGEKRGSRFSEPHKRTEGVVRNEHSSPVEDAAIALYEFKGPGVLGKQLGHYLTGLTGTVSFGVLPPGQYVMRVTQLPPGHTLRTQNDQPFRISSTDPKRRVVFIVENGAAPTSTYRMRSINICPHALTDPGVPYSLEKMVEPTWQLQINTEYGPYREAIDSKDELRQIVLFADMVACGVAQHCLKDMDVDHMMLGRCRLFSKYMEMLGIGDTRKRTRK